MTHLSKPKWQTVIDAEDWKQELSNLNLKQNEKINTSVSDKKSSWSCTEKRKTRRA